jgi:hypothetical protein
MCCGLEDRSMLRNNGVLQIATITIEGKYSLQDTVGLY